MKIYIDVNENEVVQSWATSKGMESEIEIEVPEDHEFLNSIPFFWHYTDGVLVNSNKLAVDRERGLKIDELNDSCNKAINEGFSFNGSFFQFNPNDQSNFNQQLAFLLMDQDIQTVTWKTENKGIQNFTRDEFIEACKAGEAHKRNNIGKYWTLKQYILTHEFTSVEEIQAIDLTYQIPEQVIA